MAIEFLCGSCKTPHRVRDERAGKRLACKNCGEMQKVPSRAAASSRTRKETSGSSRRRGGKSRGDQGSRKWVPYLALGFAGLAATVTTVVVVILLLRNANERNPADEVPNEAQARAEKSEPPDDVARANADGDGDAQKPVAKVQAEPKHDPPPQGELELLEEWTYDRLNALKPKLKRESKKTRNLEMKRSRRRLVAVVTYNVRIEYAHPESTQYIGIELSARFVGTSPNYKYRQAPSGEDGDVRFRQRYTPQTPMYLTQFARGGERTGLAFCTHKNGVPRSRGSYSAGKRDGSFVIWNEQGDRIWEGTYDQGRLTDSKVFAPGQKPESPDEILLGLATDREIKWMAMETVFQRKAGRKQILSRLSDLLNVAGTPPAWAVKRNDYLSRLAEMTEQADKADLPDVPVSEALAFAKFAPEGDPRNTIAANLIAKHGAKAIDELKAAQSKIRNSALLPVVPSALKRIGPAASPAIPFLYRYLATSYISRSLESSREPLWNGIVGIGPEGIKLATNFIKNYNGRFMGISDHYSKLTVRVSKSRPVMDAVVAIGRLKSIDAGTKQFLLDLTRTQTRQPYGSDIVLLAAAEALARHDQKLGVDRLLELVKRMSLNWKMRKLDPETRARYFNSRHGQAVRSLAAAGDESRRALPLLRKLAGDPFSTVRPEAALAVARLVPAEAPQMVPAITEGLANFKPTVGFKVFESRDMILVKGLAELGPAAKPAAPALTRLRQRLEKQIAGYQRLRRYPEQVKECQRAIKIVDDILATVGHTPAKKTP